MPRGPFRGFGISRAPNAIKVDPLYRNSLVVIGKAYFFYFLAVAGSQTGNLFLYHKRKHFVPLQKESVAYLDSAQKAIYYAFDKIRKARVSR